MDFLTMCQRVRLDAGISGTGPVTVVGQSTILGRIINGVNEAWLRIQNNPKEWKWMWRDGYNLPTIANVDKYILTDVGRIYETTFVGYLQSSGVSSKYRLKYMDWSSFKTMVGALQTVDSDKPLIVTQRPNGSFQFYPVPDDIYIIDFEYLKSPQVLTADTDIPEMPEDFHDLIINEALLRIGGLDDAAEVINTAMIIAGNDGSNGRPATGLWRSLIWDQEIRRARFLQVRPE